MSRTYPESPKHTAILLRQALSQLHRSLSACLPPTGATVAQLSVLGHLFRIGELTPSELAQIEGVRLQSLTRLLAAIEAEGWVIRQADAKDARRSRLRLTKAGAELLSNYVHRREASLEEAIAGCLSESEQGTLREACTLMDRLSASLHAVDMKTCRT